MHEEGLPDLHDARIGELEINFEVRVIKIFIEYYPTLEANQRKSAWLTFENVDSISQIANLSQLAQNRGAGNINYWLPALSFGTTFIYLVNGCITILSSPPSLVDC